jgi:diacylglycerol kinase family enzyme
VGRTDHGDLVLLMLSAGPDALVLSRLGAVTKRLGGRVGVAVQACIELVRAEMPRLKVITDQRDHSGSWAIVGKSRCYAGPFHATPGADPFAEHLELVLLTGTGRARTCGFLLGIPAGRHVRRRDVLRRDSRRVRLEPDPAHARVPYQVDGDVKGELPVEIWTDPEPLRIRIPPPLAGEMLAVKSETYATP